MAEQGTSQDQRWRDFWPIFGITLVSGLIPCLLCGLDGFKFWIDFTAVFIGGIFIGIRFAGRWATPLFVASFLSSVPCLILDMRLCWRGHGQPPNGFEFAPVWFGLFLFAGVTNLALRIYRSRSTSV